MGNDAILVHKTRQKAHFLKQKHYLKSHDSGRTLISRTNKSNIIKKFPSLSCSLHPFFPVKFSGTSETHSCKQKPAHMAEHVIYQLGTTFFSLFIIVIKKKADYLINFIYEIG